MTYTSLITFHVAPGRSAAFEEAFAATGMLTRPTQVPGYRGARLHRGIDDPDTYIVIGHWDTEAAYRTWQRYSADTDPEALTRLLDTLVDPRPGQLFEPVATSRPAGPEDHPLSGSGAPDGDTRPGKAVRGGPGSLRDRP